MTKLQKYIEYYLGKQDAHDYKASLESGDNETIERLKDELRIVLYDMHNMRMSVDTVGRTEIEIDDNYYLEKQLEELGL